jgi:N-carbamoylputrescine amidase
LECASSSEEAVLVRTLDLAKIEEQRIAWPFFRDRRIDAYGGLMHRFGGARGSQ